MIQPAPFILDGGIAGLSFISLKSVKLSGMQVSKAVLWDFLSGSPQLVNLELAVTVTASLPEDTVPLKSGSVPRLNTLKTNNSSSTVGMEIVRSRGINGQLIEEWSGAVLDAELAMILRENRCIRRLELCGTVAMMSLLSCLEFLERIIWNLIFDGNETQVCPATSHCVI